MFRILQKIKTYPNTIKIKPILISFALIPILALKCTDSIIDDGPVTNTPKFEWVTDTLWARDAQQIYMYDIWGTDKNNVWVVGHSDRTKYQIWQWDGQEWKSINPQIVGYRPSYSEIFGFSEEDFWIVGSCAHLFPGDSLDTKGYILHYDGAWKRIDNNNLPKCMSVWGTSSNNMYIGCYEGILLRYDGSNFYKYYSGVDAQIHSIWGIGDSIVYALGNKIIVNQNYTSSIPYLSVMAFICRSSVRTRPLKPRVPRKSVFITLAERLVGYSGSRSS